MSHRPLLAASVALIQMAAQLRNWATQLAGAAAWLGDAEFTVLLPGRRHRPAAAIAARVTDRELTRPDAVPPAATIPADTGRNNSDLTVVLHVSVGAEIVPAGHLNLGQLLHAGASAMYAAKRSRSGWALRSAGTGQDPAGPGTAYLTRPLIDGRPKGCEAAGGAAATSGQLLARDSLHLICGGGSTGPAGACGRAGAAWSAEAGSAPSGRAGG